MSSKVSIIIINWNGWEDTIECLESVLQINYDNYNIILVDNCSEDNSIEMIERYCKGELKVNSEYFNYDSLNKPIQISEYFEEELRSGEKNNHGYQLKNSIKVTIIKNKKNHGFSGGNNIGIEYAMENFDPEYVLLLNNDTVVDKEFLNELILPLENDRVLGLSGPKIYYYTHNNQNNIINFAGGKINFLTGTARHIGFNETDKQQYNEMEIVDYLEGSCILIRKNVFDEVGLLDDNYFAYWEETDFCMRALKKNYASIFVPKAKIWHKVSSSSKGKLKTYYITRNRFWFNREHSNKKQYTIFILYFFFIEFIFRLIMYILFDKNDTLCFLKGIKDGVK